MRIEVSSAAGPLGEPMLRRRLDAVLARYADVIRRVAVRCPAPAGRGCEIEIVFVSGPSLRVVQDQAADEDDLLHLADRVGRAIARRLALE